MDLPYWLLISFVKKILHHTALETAAIPAPGQRNWSMPQRPVGQK
jgi:hypothetical protein